MAPNEENGKGKKVQTEMIHPGLRAEFRDKAQRPSDVRFTTLSTAEVVSELSAHLNLTEKPKRKKTIPKVMRKKEKDHTLSAWKSVMRMPSHIQKCDSGLSLEHSWKRRLLSHLSGYAVPLKKW